jgi:hypothetical protein
VETALRGSALSSRIVRSTCRSVDRLPAIRDAELYRTIEGTHLRRSGSAGWQLPAMMLRMDFLQPHKVHERQPAKRRVVDGGALSCRRVALEGCRRGVQAVQDLGTGARGRARPQRRRRLAARWETTEPQDRTEQERAQERPHETWCALSGSAATENVAARLVRQREMLGNLEW